MLEDTYGHTPFKKAFEQGDVYGIGYDEERVARRRLRLGMIGAGGVAQSKYFPAIARLRSIWEPLEIAAFAEPVQAQGHKVQEIFGGRWYTDYRVMLAQEELDGVLVLSPDSLHAEHSTAAMGAGCHVLVEKPISRSLVDSEQMCQLAVKKQLVLIAVANKRFSPPYRRAKKFVDEGLLRNPVMLSAKFNLGYEYVDLLEGGTIHLFDLARFYMGDVVEVQALGVRRRSGEGANYPVDNVVVNLEFVSGALGTLSTSASALSLKPWERVEIYGEHAWLVVDDQRDLILYDSEEGPAKSWSPVWPNTLLFDEEFAGYMGIVENFAQAIRGNEAPLVVGLDGHRALELCVACHLSIARREPVRLPLDPTDADAELARWFARSKSPGGDCI